MNLLDETDGRYSLVEKVESISTPSTIQDVIMARVDALPESAKEVIQTASGIEREFSYTLLSQVVNRSEQNLLSDISVLRDSELIFERGIYPESTYIFKHALTQEVVYDSILVKKKANLHAKIGIAMEKIHKDNIEEFYGILSEHFIAGEVFRKGAEYSRLAGRKAEKNASFPDAIEYAKKRINCVEKLAQTPDTIKEIIDARISLGLYRMFPLSN